MPVAVTLAAEPSAPATRPAYPALEELNRDCLALTRQLQGSILRVQVPPPRIANANDLNRFERYQGKLTPEVKKALQQQAARGGQQGYNANGNAGNSTNPPNNYRNGSNGYGGGQYNRDNRDQQSPQQNGTQQNTGQQQPAAQQVPQQQVPQQTDVPRANAPAAQQQQANPPANPNEQQVEQRQQNLTIIVPVSGNSMTVDNGQQAGNGAILNNVVNFKGLPAFAPTTVGLLLDEQKGYVLVPIYIDREAVADQPLRLSPGDGEPVDGKFVGSDQQTQLTVLQLLPPVNKEASKEISKVAGQKAAAKTGEHAARAINEEVPGLGKPVRLSNHPVADGSLVVVISADGAGRLVVWNGPPKDSSVIVDIDGQVAGISRGGQFLSGAHCRLIAEQIIRHGAVKRATLGVIISQVDAADPDRQQVQELGDKPAVRIDEVVKGSVADKAGLQQGDLVLTVAGEPVRDIPSLAAAIAARNGPTQLSILRDGKTRSVTVELTQHN